MRKLQLAAASGLLSVLAASSSVQAFIVPLLDGSPAANGANYNWTYNADIGPDIRVVAGDFFTIYDFGLVLGHSEPAGWTFSTSLLGPNPLLIAPVDDPAIANVTFTYNGPNSIIGAADLGNFILTIASNAINTNMPYGAEATRHLGTQDGRFASDYGVLAGPAFPDSGPPIPEPASLGLLLAAAPLAVRRRRD